MPSKERYKVSCTITTNKYSRMRKKEKSSRNSDPIQLRESLREPSGGNTYLNRLNYKFS